MDAASIKKQAEAELAAEDFKAAVANEKAVIVKRRNFWLRLFPWRLRIERKDTPLVPMVWVKDPNEWDFTYRKQQQSNGVKAGWFVIRKGYE